MAFIYADICIVIYLIEGDFSRRERIAEYLLRSDDAPNRIGFSDLTRMECLIHPVRERNMQLRSACEEFFKGPFSDYIPLTSEVFEKATELRAEYGLKTPDAIHLAAALVRTFCRHEIAVWPGRQNRSENRQHGTDRPLAAEQGMPVVGGMRRRQASLLRADGAISCDVQSRSSANKIGHWAAGPRMA